MKLSSTLLEITLQLDAKGQANETKGGIEQAILTTVKENKPLRLFSFTCSTIQSQYLFSDTPWLYVSTDVSGNNVEADLPRLESILAELRTVYPTELVILIGNTDPYYIYLQQFNKWSKEEQEYIWKQFSLRWEEYKNNLEVWIKNTFPSLNASVLSWYTFESDIEKKIGRSFEKEFTEIYKNIDQYAPKADREWELRQLKTQFGPGKYFTALECPPEELLRDWIDRKFAEYALQAEWIYEYLGPSLLIQNEKPSDLRTRMYQPLVQEKYKNKFPVVYFFGVDNAGYQ